MNWKAFEKTEAYMLSCMEDSAHDKEHIYRVLYTALDIASGEKDVDYEILITACLLHDIGRKEQFENPALCHAAVGGDKAFGFLLENGWTKERAGRVKEAIAAHRFRSDKPPVSAEARIVFDADKLDVTGAIGIARTLLYAGETGCPLYTKNSDGTVDDGSGDGEDCFFREYKRKLETLYDRFFTRRGAELAAGRKAAAEAFYTSMRKETEETCRLGKEWMEKLAE